MAHFTTQDHSIQTSEQLWYARRKTEILASLYYTNTYGNSIFDATSSSQSRSLTTMASAEIVKCTGITKSYGTIVALKNITLSMCEGESVALAGANGAGKSTLFNIICGLLKSDEGTCSIVGTSSGALTPQHRAKIGFIADHAGPIPWASANDLAMLYSKIYADWDGEFFNTVISSWKIDRYRRLNNLSKGQKRLAEIALIMSIRPAIMILDEPFDGLDAVMRIKIQNHLRNLQQQSSTTILYATHIITELSSIADRMLVLRAGDLVYDQPVATAHESPDAIFRRLYSTEIGA